MKKILQINILNENGSTGKIVQGISNAIEISGMKSYTAYGYGNSNLKNSYRIGSNIDYYIHNFLSRALGHQGRFSFLSTKKLLKYIKRERFDLVHLHNIHGNYINYKLLFEFLYEERIPVVWTFHDCWPFTGKCVHFTTTKCNKWINGCDNCPIIHEYPKSYFFDNSKKDYILKKKLFKKIPSMTIITPSHWLKLLVKKSFLQDKECIVIHNGIDTTKFKPTPNNLRLKYKLENKKIVLGVANPWSKHKGFDDFMIMSKKLPENFVIVMIGLSKNQLKEVNEVSSILGVEKTSSINELAMWYSVADVFVNPTYEDNFPTVNMEAIACNTPVVAYDTGGCKEIVKDPYGKTCPCGDIEKLVKYTIEFSNKKVCSGYDFICNNFDKNNIYQNYIKIYKNILDN